MKTKLILFILSGMVLIGCSKKADEPTPPEPEPQPQPLQIDSISQDVLLSYFPYKNSDRIVYYNDLIGNINYTVVESILLNESDTTTVKTSMFGYDYKGVLSYIILMEAKLISKHVLTIDFYHGVNIISSRENIRTTNSEIGAYSTRGSYTYDAASGQKLPASITLSNGSIIKQNEGLIYFVDYDAEKWYFNKRL